MGSVEVVLPLWQCLEPTPPRYALASLLEENGPLYEHKVMGSTAFGLLVRVGDGDGCAALPAQPAY